MKSVCFHGSKLKLVKALLFRSFHETEAPTAGFCSAFICGRAYSALDLQFRENSRPSFKVCASTTLNHRVARYRPPHHLKNSYLKVPVLRY